MAIIGNLNSAHCVSATATVASFTFGPGSLLPNGTLVWSYSAAPTGGRVYIIDSNNVVYLDMDVASTSTTLCGEIPITNGGGGAVGGSNATNTVTFAIASGGGAVVGKLTFIHN